LRRLADAQQPATAQQQEEEDDADQRDFIRMIPER